MYLHESAVFQSAIPSEIPPGLLAILLVYLVKQLAERTKLFSKKIIRPTKVFNSKQMVPINHIQASFGVLNNILKSAYFSEPV